MQCPGRAHQRTLLCRMHPRHSVDRDRSSRREARGCGAAQQGSPYPRSLIGHPHGRHGWLGAGPRGLWNGMGAYGDPSQARRREHPPPRARRSASLHLAPCHALTATTKPFPTHHSASLHGTGRISPLPALALRSNLPPSGPRALSAFHPLSAPPPLSLSSLFSPLSSLLALLCRRCRLRLALRDATLCGCELGPRAYIGIFR